MTLAEALVALVQRMTVQASLIIFPAVFATTAHSNPVELVCEGKIETQIVGDEYKGNQRAFVDDMRLEITFHSDTKTVTRVFSSRLRMSVCFLDKTSIRDCTCTVDTNEVSCFMKDKTSLSGFSINRKTGVATVTQQGTWGSLEAPSNYITYGTANLPCQVYDKNKF